MTHHILRQTH